MTFQQPLIFLLVEFLANAMDCAHFTTRNPPPTRHRYSTTSGMNGGVSGAGGLYTKVGPSFVVEKMTSTEKNYFFPIPITNSHLKD